MSGVAALAVIAFAGLFILFAIAVLGKVVSGFAVFWRKLNRLAVGMGMVPRGEVGLIFAQLGLLGGILSQDEFSAILIMVMGTTLMTPPILKVLFQRSSTEPEEEMAAEESAR